jgi:hypothetical protein
MLKRILVTLALSACSAGAWAQSSGIVTTSAPNYAPYVNQSVALSLDESGNLRVTSTSSGSTTANQGTANTAANGWPVYLEFGGTALPLGQALSGASIPVVLPAAQITALTPPAAITNYAQETGGNLATVATAQGVSGTGITQPTGGSGILGWLSGIYNAVISALPAGSNIIGKVGIDQTTVGTTNATSLAYIGSSATVPGTSGADGVSTNLISLNVRNFGLLFNGSTFDRARSGGVTGMAGVSLQASPSGAYSYSHISTATTTTVKSGSGTLHSVTVNALGTVASVLTVYDNTAGSGTVVAAINSLSITGTLTYDVTFTTGLTIVSTGTVAPDVTVSYK